MDEENNNLLQPQIRNHKKNKINWQINCVSHSLTQHNSNVVLKSYL